MHADEQVPAYLWDTCNAARHLVEYQYGETLARRTWLTATEGLPEIVEHLEPLLSN